MSADLNDFQATRQSLVARLKDWEDQESWRLFFETYWKLIYSVAARSGLNDAAAQDIVQETVLCVAKSIRSFSYTGKNSSFKSWLLTITRRRIIDSLRRQGVRPTAAGNTLDETATPWINRIPDPASLDWQNLWDSEWEKNLVEAALANVRRRVRPLQYQIFDCLVFKQWPAREITRKLRVSLAQVYFAKCKISCMLQREICRLGKEWL